MANWDIEATEKFEVGWSRINLLSDKKIQKILFIYLSATLLHYTINILDHPSYTAIGRVISHSVISFLLFFGGSLWINEILNKKYYKIILFFFLINSSFFYLVSINYYFSIGYLLNLILIKKLISENSAKMEDLGLSFKNLRRNIIIGVTIGILGAAYLFFIFSLGQGFEFEIFSFDRYLEFFLGIFIVSLYGFTFFIGLIFNYWLKRGMNVFVAILVLTALYIIFNFGYVEILKDIQLSAGYLFFTVIWTFIYCGIFLLYRNIVPIALFYTITIIIAFSFGVVK